MKRLGSIFLSLIILLAGAHPVLAMHFCAGDLFSVNIIKDSQENHSCCEKIENMSIEDCGNESQPHPTQYSSLIGENDSCCTSNHVSLSTDNFNNQLQQLNLNNILPSFDNVWFTLYSVLNYLQPDFSVSDQHFFPPGGLNRLNIDLLTYICIYRI